VSAFLLRLRSTPMIEAIRFVHGPLGPTEIGSKFLSPKLRSMQSKELTLASLAQLRQQPGGHAVQRKLIAELQFAMSPLGNGWAGPGQFEFRRFQATTGSFTRCEDVWLESPQPGQWKILSFALWMEPGGDCLARGDIEAAAAWAHQVLLRLDATTADPLDPDVFAPIYLSTFTHESAQRYLDAFRGKGPVSDRKLMIAFPTARSPLVPAKPGRYIFVRFFTVTSMSSVWEDLWLENLPPRWFGPAHPQPRLVTCGVVPAVLGIKQDRFPGVPIQL
jgi:hypothetical protein